MATFKIEITCVSREQMNIITNAICHWESVRDIINKYIYENGETEGILPEVDPTETRDNKTSTITKYINYFNELDDEDIDYD